MKRRKVVYWLIGGFVALIAAMVIIKKAGGESGIKVAVDKAGTKDIVEAVSASGKIYPEIEVKVSSDISGEITDLLVMEGDSVSRGQVLARIYADIYGSARDRAAAAVSQQEAELANSAAAVNAFKARLDQAKAAFDRNSELLEQKVISRSEFETAEATYKAALSDYNAAQQRINSSRFGVASAQANLTEANKNLGRTTIVSPMSGIVSLLSIKKGERVVGTAQMTGTEMLRIADMKTMEVQVEVGENDIPKVKYNDSALIEVDAYVGRKFKGVVTQIASSSQAAATTTGAATSAEQTTNYIVHIRILPESYADLIDPAGRRYPFRPGMSASADIQTRTEKQVLAIPINAVTTRNPKDSTRKSVAETPEEDRKDFKEVVFVLQPDKTVKMVEVTTGIQDNNNIQVTSGLKGGEEVVSGPYEAVSRQLEQGKKVRVVPRSQLFEVKK